MAINAFDTPDQLTPASIKDAKADAVIAVGRYISGGGSWKHLTAAEVAACRSMGMKLWLIDEGTGSAAQFAAGEAAGKAAGVQAAIVANAFGVPAGTAIFVGVDYDAGEADVANITNYMKGYKAGCAPYKAGMYADGLIAMKVPTDVGTFVPGAGGWNGTKEYLAAGKNIAIIQHPPVKAYGLDTDPCEVRDTSVLWTPGAPAPAPVEPPEPVPPIPPKPTPVPSPAPAPKPPVTVFTPPKIADWQKLLGYPVTGVMSIMLAYAIRNYYSNHPDG